MDDKYLPFITSSNDGEDCSEIEGLVYKPPDFDPTLLQIHGGPMSQYDFSFEAQLFATNAYVMVLTIPEGPSGYG